MPSPPFDPRPSTLEPLCERHAFDAPGAHRVTPKTDARNERSQRAIERIGAAREGVLRRQRVRWDGTVRDGVYYGVADDTWPEVKARLVALTAPR